jgi:hypothetical protein
MIGLANHNIAEEKGIEAPDATSLGWETGPEQPLGSPLEWYLMKLLEPTEDAPHEQVPQSADEGHVEETAAPPQLDAIHHGQRDATEVPKESTPLWPTADEEPAKAQAATSAASIAKPKSTIRSYAQIERASGSRQKLMVAIIPVLAIVMVVLLKHPLGARSTAKAAGVQATETARAIIPEVEIAWTIPSSYELGGRDPMRPAPPTVEEKSAQTVGRLAETPIELIVTGILHSADKPAAIVDTQVVHEGQRVSGATVEKIDRDGVQFERNGRRWKQTINK